MCGIVGFLGTGGADVLAAMNGAIVHRGPDDAGSYFSPPVALAMRRLSIIDVAGGHQPMANETGRLRIVFNGELYNYRELKADYLARHQFSTATDTEVVIHLYEEFGEAAFEKLNGMYAFALWDGDRACLYLVRDRLGVKPLYYHLGPERLTFASEIKALLQDPGIARKMDPTALAAYLTWQYVPGPDTLLEGVKKLPPGHFLRLRPGERPELRAYWEPRLASERHSNPDDFDAVFHAAIKRQMVSDVPVGAFLSGGLDSSLVVAHMREEVGDRLQVFTAGFEDPRLDETPWASAVATHLGLEHHVLRLGIGALDDLPRLAWHLDEPVGDRAALPTFHLSRFARPHVKVVLTGEGSDELFGGYPRYRLERMARRFHRLPLADRRALWGALVAIAPGALRPRLAKLLLSESRPGRRRMAWVANHPSERLSRLLVDPTHAVIEPPEPLDDSLGAQLLLDLRTWLVDNVLMKVDKMTMAASIEARVPFLDHDLVDWALALPDQAKLKGTETKWLLKQAASARLPAAVIHRKKQAFHTPTALWFREPKGRAWLQDVLLGDAARQRGLLVPAEVERLILEHQRGRDCDQALWNLLILELWFQHYLDRVPAPALST